MKTLKDAKVDDVVVVKRLHGEGPIKRRIMDMGITKGVQIKVRKVAPLGDPIELNVRGYELSTGLFRGSVTDVWQRYPTSLFFFFSV